MRPIIIHHHNCLSIGGTERMCQIMMKHFVKEGTYNHVLAYKAQEDRSREQYFREIMGSNKLIAYASYPEFITIVRRLRPFIIHRYSAGIPEFPFIQPVKDNTKHFVSTSVFGNQDDTIDISRVIFVSKHVQHLAQRFGDKYRVVRNAIEDIYTDKKHELGIKEDAFVFGHIGRPDENTFDDTNLKAYKKIETDKTWFLWLPRNSMAMVAAKDLGIKNFHMLERTTNETELSKFYNTIDVFAHARRDGECNPAVMFEAFAHSKPVISVYGLPFNGHIECVGNAGFVVPPGDVDEYARIMQAFIDDEVDYKKLCKNARGRYEEWGEASKWANKQLEIYKELM